MDLRIPRSGSAGADVQLVEWSVVSGAAVKAGDRLYSIECDKTVTEFTSPCAGEIKILVGEGSAVEVGKLVGHLL
jgi:pyruvate/2-oxoglutarate dehydrogenase complex dihydrolipoamide acyltransferase (E2) component